MIIINYLLNWQYYYIVILVKQIFIYLFILLFVKLLYVYEFYTVLNYRDLVFNVKHSFY